MIKSKKRKTLLIVILTFINIAALIGLEEIVHISNPALHFVVPVISFIIYFVSEAMLTFMTANNKEK